MDAKESEIKSGEVKRTGLHRFFHVSRGDKYVSALGGIVFLTIVVLKVTGLEISFISWTDAFQIAILFGISGVVSQMYYRLFEERYDK